MTTTKVKHIYWTETEHKDILDELARLEEDNQIEFSKLSIIKQVKLAQKVLSTDRQKVISGKHHFNSLFKYLGKSEDGFSDQRKQPNRSQGETESRTPLHLQPLDITSPLKSEAESLTDISNYNLPTLSGVPKEGTKRTLVRWTKQECIALAKEVVLNQQADEKLNLLEAVKISQLTILPLNRHRHLYIVNNVKKLIPYIEKAKEDFNKQQEQAIRSHNESEFNSRPVGFSDIFDQFFTPSTHTPTVEEQSPAEAIADAIFATMVPKVTELMQEVNGLVSKRLKAFVLEQAKEIAVPTPQKLIEALESFEPVKKKVKPELQRVLTLGFKLGGPIKLEDYDKLDVRFCEDQAEIRRIMNDNTIVIQAPRRSAHLNGDIKKKAIRIIMVNGGQTELARQLHALNVTLVDNKVE